MKKILTLLTAAEKHLEQAKEKLEALDGRDSPEDLVNRVNDLRISYDHASVKLTEKKLALWEVLIELARLSHVGVMDSRSVGHYEIRDNVELYKSGPPYGFGSHIKREILVSKPELFYPLCNLLMEGISGNLEMAIRKPGDEITKVEGLTKRVLEILEPLSLEVSQ